MDTVLRRRPGRSGDRDRQPVRHQSGPCRQPVGPRRHHRGGLLEIYPGRGDRPAGGGLDLSSLDDLARHPQNRYRDAVDENGAFRLLAPGALVEGEQPAVLRVPALGEHDDSLRAEFADGGEA